MTREELDELIGQVDAQRPRRVLDHIRKHGQVSTEELREVYGYRHGPRAARDVREWGIPLETIRDRDKNGRSIGAYILGDPKNAVGYKIGGRLLPPKTIKEYLLALHGDRCALCNLKCPPSKLQVDHRVPYEIAGEHGAAGNEIYQLVCASCNRTKSWACEHCPNLLKKDPAVCLTCMWASPLNYEHIATELHRSVTVTWEENDASTFDKLRILAESQHKPISALVKETLDGFVRRTEHL